MKIMKILKLFFLLLVSPIIFTECPDVLNHDVRILDSKDQRNLCEYEGKVILAVNVASRCGFVYQYEELQNLFKKYEKPILFSFKYLSVSFPLSKGLPSDSSTKIKLLSLSD